MSLHDHHVDSDIMLDPSPQLIGRGNFASVYVILASLVTSKEVHSEVDGPATSSRVRHQSTDPIISTLSSLCLAHLRTTALTILIHFTARGSPFRPVASGSFAAFDLLNLWTNTFSVECDPGSAVVDV
ncbi:hypothetical protein ARMGADRAFT_572135 [Armillaria gallica]|uniref:Uncharacterized protein n=1 Tax=Armillaria gallica TaxID=47427 RepID=A0A2H3EFR9_ARMGA|nr:hypothetical protein ARMGADRAFT_572135 [Armillaria gallica]